MGAARAAAPPAGTSAGGAGVTRADKGGNKEVPEAGVPFVGNEGREWEEVTEGRVRLKEVVVGKQDVLDWDVVGVEGDGQNGAVCGLGGGRRGEGLSPGDAASSGESVAAEVLRVASMEKEREHSVGLSGEVRVRAADATEAKKLREGNAALGRLGVTGGEEKVGVSVSRFVVDSGGHRGGVRRDRDLKVEKRETVVRDVESELNSRMKVGGKVDEAEEVVLGAGSDTKAVVNEAPVKDRFDASVLLEDLLLKATHEKAGVARTHPGPHGNTAGLKKVLVVELERVESENEFSQTEKSSDREITSVLREEVLEGQHAVRMRNAGVESSDVHSEQIAVKTVRRKGEVSEKAEGVVGVLEVGWEPGYDGLEDKIKKA
mgnify:FL=1